MREDLHEAKVEIVRMQAKAETEQSTMKTTIAEVKHHLSETVNNELKSEISNQHQGI